MQIVFVPRSSIQSESVGSESIGSGEHSNLGEFEQRVQTGYIRHIEQHLCSRCPDCEQPSHSCDSADIQ